MRITLLTISTALGWLLIAPAAQADEWRASTYRSPVFVAGIRNAALAGIDIECRATNYGRSEVTIDLRVPTSTSIKPAAALALAFSAGQKTTALTMQRLGNDWGTDVYRWTAWDAADYETARSLGESLHLSQTLEVKDAATGTVIAFSFSYTSHDDGASGAIRRCGKEAMHAREHASRMTDPKVLLAFEDDADEKCRGGSGDERATWNACDERQEYYERLNALDWCHGKIGQIHAEMTWHRCVVNSQR